VKVESVEIKDVSLPEGMKRSMSRQAEAERERRARIITADGEFQASKRLAAAANVMARDPAALQLRLLQTVVEVAAERNSTLVMPIPVELLRFFDKGNPSTSGSPQGSSMADFSDVAKMTREAEAELGSAESMPLEIPDVPAIPELSAAEKGDVGTVHHAERSGAGAVTTDPGDSADTAGGSVPGHNGQSAATPEDEAAARAGEPDASA